MEELLFVGRRPGGVGGGRGSLLDWRRFGDHYTAAISGAGSWSGGVGLLGSVARARETSGRGLWIEERLFRGPRAEDAVPRGGAGADCHCLVPLQGFHFGAR